MDKPPPHPSAQASGLAWFLGRFQRHSGELARLAGPVVISRAGILTLAVVDTVMLGPLGADAVAHYGLGTSTFVVLLVFGIGLLFGTVVETSHLRGEGRLNETGHVWRRAVPYAMVLGLIGLALTQFTESYFLAVGQDAELAEASASVTRIQGIGLLPMMVYVVSNFYLESMGRPLPGMIAIWGANILNVVLNFWLIGGGLGVDGADGAALATTICRIGMMVGLVGYVWYLGGREDFGIRTPTPDGWITGGRSLRRHGYAAGAAYVSESGAYHAMHIFAGWMATAQLAAFTISMNMFAMIFMASLGIANATAVRVGVAHGRRDWPDRALAGWTGCFWVITGLLPLAAAIAIWPSEIMVTVYAIDDASLLAVVAPVAVVAAYAMMLDGGQFTLANALRATGDALVPTLLNFIGFICVLVPASYVIGIVFERGAKGLFEAVVLASAVTFVILAIRWTWVCARPPKD